ncbi:MAG: hypothetical protein ACT4TC_04865 [Myxococcaceae bacterium]
MGARHSKLAAALAAAWEAEVVAARRLCALAERSGDPYISARLTVLSAFCRAHASRLLARLSALGRGPLPVPDAPEGPNPFFLDAILEEASVARLAAIRYASMAELARSQHDLSSAWVCELNRSEEEERGAELLRLAQAAFPRYDHAVR